MKTKIRRTKTASLFLALIATSLLCFGKTSPAPLPFSQQAGRLQDAIEHYREIQQKGGWPLISLPKKPFKTGISAPEIRELKKRLQVTGELSPKDTSALFTPALEESVKKVQRQFGFAENGIVDKNLVKALNIPVEKRLQQLKRNLERQQTVTLPAEGWRIVVNIPEFKLRVYENGNPVLELNVIVGKESSKTATFDEELTFIVFSPYWNVPTSIVQNEILPATKKKRNYLSANGYEITGYEDGLPVIRQKPGAKNALGKVKFIFPNHHAIYFHDTPVKSLFKNRVRAYSHGCIRVEDPERLAEFLLKDDPSWTPGKISAAMDASKEQWVKLPATIPVSITYFTAWVDQEGQLHFRDDIYNYDEGIPELTANK